MPVGRSDYQERKESRIRSLTKKAEKAKKESTQYIQKSKDAVVGIEPGQPVLIGHHSEKKHRAAIKKMDSAMQKAIKANDKSTYYQIKTTIAVNNQSISSDDPKAESLYKDKLEKLQALQEFMKSVNTFWRKNKTMKGYPKISDEKAAQIDEYMKTASSWVQKSGPFEKWELSNNNAEIHRIKEKIKSLEELDGMIEEIVKFPNGEMRINVKINRVQLIFTDKPSQEIRVMLKANGFNWAPSEGAWQRLRTMAAIRVAKGLIHNIYGKSYE